MLYLLRSDGGAPGGGPGGRGAVEPGGGGLAGGLKEEIAHNVQKNEQTQSYLHQFIWHGNITGHDVSPCGWWCKQHYHDNKQI